MHYPTTESLKTHPHKGLQVLGETGEVEGTVRKTGEKVTITATRWFCGGSDYKINGKWSSDRDVKMLHSQI